MSVQLKTKGTSAETTRDKILEWNEYYGSKRFGIGVECTSCKKWRHVYEYDEAHEVPEDWECSMSIIDGQKGHCDLPTKYNSDFFVEEVYVPGSIVWAKCQSYPWWPAMVEDDPDCEEYHVKGEADEDEEYHVVFFYETAMRAWIKAKDITAFVKPPSNLKGKKSMQKKLENAKVKASTAAKMTIADRLNNFSFAVRSAKKFPQSKTNIPVPKISTHPKRKTDGKNTANSNLPIKKRKTGEAYGVGNDPSTQTHKIYRNLGRKPSRALTPDAQDSQISDELVPAILSLAIAVVNPPQSPATEDPSYDVHIAANLDPSYDVPTAANLDPSYDVPIAANLGPSYDVPTAANLGPSYDVPTAANLDPSYDVPIAANLDPSYDVPTAANLDPSYDVPIAENLDPSGASHPGQHNGLLSNNEYHEEEVLDTQPMAAESVKFKVSESLPAYPVPDFLKTKQLHELFSDMDSNESSQETEKKEKAKVEEMVSETPPEEEDEIWIETNEEYYLDILTEGELIEMREQRNEMGNEYPRGDEIVLEDEDEVVDLNHPYHPVHEYIRYPN